MVGKLKKSLAWRMSAYFGAIVTVSLVLSAWVSFHSQKSTIQDLVFQRQAAFRHIAKERLAELLTERGRLVRMLATSREISEILAYASEGRSVESGAAQDISQRRYGHLAQRAHKKLGAEEIFEGFEEILLLAPDSFKVLYASREGLTMPSTEAVAKRAKVLESLWKNTLKKKDFVFGDMAHYEPAAKPCFFMAVPVSDEQAMVQAVFVAVLGGDQLKSIVEDRTGLGDSGDTYLVGTEGLLRTPSRFLAETEVLKKKVDTESVRRALAGEEGESIIVDYRSVKVLSTYGPLGLKEMFQTDIEWALLVEMDADEAFAGIAHLGVRYVLLTLILVAVALLAGYVTARGMVRPIRNLVGVIQEVAQGNLSVSIEEHARADEVGDLVQGFTNMLEALKTQTKHMQGGVNDLASSISQISATAAQLAASSAETATSISEITATVEEVRQTARLSHEKGKYVAQQSELLAHTAQEGRRSTEDALHGLQRIREEMDFVAESVMRLSEQGQSIGNIIDVVRDLADQVNLLSVNAAIEAAKAGDHGKGFAVVAQEMRSLADQSKEATEQVKQILSEIQKATSSAVMAIERGTKAVAAGLEVGQRTEKSIARLAQGVEEASDSALQIASSSQEQLVGMEQLVLAVQNIREASSQNTDAARQLESAVRGLEKLSRTLTQMLSQMRV